MVQPEVPGVAPALRVRRLPLQGAGWTRASSDVSSKPKACLLLGDVSAMGTPP